MTHTHHRRGNIKSLANDYIVITRVDRTNPNQTAYKGELHHRVEQFLTICAKHNPIAIATKDQKLQSVIRWMLGWTKDKDSGIHRCSAIKDVSTSPHPVPRAETHVVFTRKEDVLQAMNEVKQADLGLSVVVSGVFDEVFQVCAEMKTSPHTVNMSLGTWGKTDRLPLEPILSLVTMCGHSMISQHLITHLIQRIRSGIMTPEEAAIEMGKQCTCNIFNVTRGAQILREYLDLEAKT
jgi:hypothetical protein